jgi:hypothetical protein
MTAFTPDELIAGFPHSHLLKVTGEPTFEDLKVIRRLLNTDTMSVASYEVGGRHGNLGIIITHEEYFTLAVNVFPIPNNPGPSAAVVAGMMAAVITEMTRLHQEETQVYRTYHNDLTTHILMRFQTKLWVTKIVRHFNFFLTF